MVGGASPCCNERSLCNVGALRACQRPLRPSPLSPRPTTNTTHTHTHTASFLQSWRSLKSLTAATGYWAAAALARCACSHQAPPGPSPCPPAIISSRAGGRQASACLRALTHTTCRAATALLSWQVYKGLRHGVQPVAVKVIPVSGSRQQEARCGPVTQPSTDIAGACSFLKPAKRCP